MEKMTDSRAAEVLAAHNEWRRGGDGPQTEPVTLGLALSHAIARLREPAGAQPAAKLVVEKDGVVKFIRPTGLGLDLPAGEYPLHLHPSPAEAQHTPIADLLADYEANGCDHTDMAWVRAAARRYVETMPDSQARCLLHVLAQEPAEAQAQGGGEVVYHVPAEAWKAATYIIGGEDGEWCDADLFVGEHVNDDGSVGYGLLIRSADYPEEGVVPLVELDRPSTAPPSAPVGVEAPADEFSGDTPHLIRCIESLLRLDAAGALVPHGVGGHARTMLAAAAKRLAQQPTAVDGAMVERFIAATNESGRQLSNAAYDMVRRGLTAALTAQPGGSANDR